MILLDKIVLVYHVCTYISALFDLREREGGGTLLDNLGAGCRRHLPHTHTHTQCVQKSELIWAWGKLNPSKSHTHKSCHDNAIFKMFFWYSAFFIYPFKFCVSLYYLIQKVELVESKDTRII